MLVEKFGEADAKAELDRRNANALKARDELKTKAKEWQTLTDEVARLRGLLDAARQRARQRRRRARRRRIR